MNLPINRAGTWYQRGDGGRWWRWDQAAFAWQPHAGPPPPPAPPGPAAPVAGAPAAGLVPVEADCTSLLERGQTSDGGLRTTLIVSAVLAVLIGIGVLASRMLASAAPEPPQALEDAFEALADKGEAPDPARLAAAFDGVAGFGFRAMPEQTIAYARRVALSGGHDPYSAVQGRVVWRNGQIVGSVLALGVDPDAVQADPSSALYGLIVQGGGPPVRNGEVAGEPTYTIETFFGADTVAFVDRAEGIVFAVRADERRLLDELLGALAEANL